VFVESGHAAIRRARREGFPAQMLPGVSTEDCLFADLGLDPSSSGWQSFEASDFLLFRRRFDPTSALILWQVGLLGESSVKKGMTCRPERLQTLTKVLRRSYSARHPVLLYEAAQFPMCDPVIKKMGLAALARQTIVPLTTLYVPPRPSRAMDPRIARWFDEPMTTNR
jgi:hypothetical protein